MPSVVLIGAGGHCLSCIEVIESTGQWIIEGIVDRPEFRDRVVLGYSVFGCDDDLVRLAERYKHALVCVGQVGPDETRIRLFKRAIESGFILPTIVASFACVSNHATIAAGSIVFQGSCVNAGVSIGSNCIINTGAIIEHDAKIGDHCHISTGAIVNGDCAVGDGCFIGSGAILKHGVKIVSRTTIGAGAVVTKDIDCAGVYVGCPAKELI